MAYKGFDYGRCACYGLYEDRFVEVRLTIHEKIVVLKNVPQGICAQCGARVYRTEILERIEGLMRGNLKPPPEPPPPPPAKGPKGRPPSAPR